MKAVHGSGFLDLSTLEKDVIRSFFMVSTDMPFIKIKKAFSRLIGVRSGRLCFTFDSRYIFDDDTVETMGIHNEDTVYVTDNTEDPAAH